MKMNGCAIHPLIERNPARRTGIGAKKITESPDSVTFAESGKTCNLAVLTFSPFSAAESAARP
jgi:hypothetical protein